ncbi:helix-turn-helix domain-containing protein, partial [Enteractinococcus helveticum]|uniref:helix-turn-helix domain-containing protein n=1 Tax=Enteractinococcus helveticum TaxID=1837282 RepID=UPI0012373ACE
HYHHEGLLPEPSRDSNGYRRYTIADLTLLLRIRHLRELGLSVSSIREVLQRGQEQGLRDVLIELDQDLEVQQQSIAAMRKRLQALLNSEELSSLSEMDTAPSRGVFVQLRALGAYGPTFQLEHTMMSAVPEEAAQEWSDLWNRILSDPEDAQSLATAYAEFDALGTSPADDPRIGVFAERIWQLIPHEYLDQLVVSQSDTAHPLVHALMEQLSSAQRSVMHQLLARISSHEGPVNRRLSDEETP